MTAKESGMEEYIAYVSELYKMPFSISDMPEKKKDYHRKKRLGKKKSSDLLYSNDAYINDGSGNPGHHTVTGVQHLMLFYICKYFFSCIHPCIHDLTLS